ncbi:hypothetical protein [Streptosporangium sp. NPDC087985]|uniref:hypothetical protein n=1 Tax=Streptosporangium sp. NPDC087985 TaxID=3366196 RepID=UPI00382BA226
MGEDEWLELAYRDRTWVTQLDGDLVENARGTVSGTPTSSSMSPGLVVWMLEIARISEGDRVLEVGTGTGYSTALLCHRLGSEAVASVECDPVVAGRARGALTGAGYAPALVVGDGLGHYERNAGYDRLIASCSVRHIPIPWVWQLRDGGTITTPMSGWMCGDAFVHLTLGAGSTASGRFLAEDIHFMTTRSHGPPPMAPPYLTGGEVRESRVDPWTLPQNEVSAGFPTID